MSLVFEARQDAWSRQWLVWRNGVTVERGLPSREAAVGAALVLAQAEQRRCAPHASVRIEHAAGCVRLGRTDPSRPTATPARPGVPDPCTSCG